MRINHNIAALNTLNKLSTNQVNTEKSLEKLSSGLRINRAGDDAAGLAISEKMRGQIRGLDQASNNASDGISLIKTAEGALNETHSILQRMRELSVQTANDTNTDDDRKEMQKEMDQLTAEISRISNDTEFNTKKLLNGDMASKVTSATPAVISSVLVNGDIKAGIYTATVDVKDATGTFGTDVSTGITGIGTTGTAGIMDVSATTLAAGSYTLTVSDWTATTSTLNITDSSGKNVGTVSGSPATALSIAGINLAAASITAAGTATFTIDSAMTKTATATAVGDPLNTVVSGFEFDVNVDALNGDTSIITVDNSEVSKFQIGANSDQNTSLAINDMSALALGVSEVNITTQAGANTAISTVSSAITRVSSERAKLGGMQNRLEHTINNLSVTSENLASSESRIRDVDMAKEMMEFTKNNILSQAATAMLAQANQQPQSVLQLLQ